MTVAADDRTVLQSILQSMTAAADYHHDESVAPAAILWPDEKREWERLIPRLRLMLPQLLVLGPYDPTARTGPAIWLRCVLAGRMTPAGYEGGSAGVVPIIYLPGVSRATIRATDECPNELKPLAELQYRGVFWSQVNGKDWTVTAFMQTNHGGLQLKIPKDQTTAAAIRRSIEKLVDVSVVELQAKSASGDLNTAYFNLLVSEDPIDDLLSWLADPEGKRKQWDNDRWEAMCSDAIKNYGFDPHRDGALVGAEKLGMQEKSAWKTAWKRFVAAPSRYPGLMEQLRRAKPVAKSAGLFEKLSEFWPQDNETAENDLRQALEELAGVPMAEARLMLAELEKKHQHRRDWVWAALRMSPLAQALQHLARLAEVTQTPLTGGTTADMVKAYTEGGWKADAAVLDALASVVHPGDMSAMSSVIAHIYTPWLRDAAELFQLRTKHEPLPGRKLPRLAEVTIGTCVLFVDGLRYDVGQKLRAAVEAKLGPVHLQHHFVAMPSVTPTAKPAVSPLASLISGTSASEEFRPCIAVDAKDLTPERFRKLLDDAGYQFLTVGETGDPAGRAWTEYGDVDQTGHKEELGLARRIPEFVASLVHRVESLLNAGWREVRIVTDHGWLLVPKGLPKTDLPKYLTATRWGRCAVVKPAANIELTCFDWFWHEEVRIACPPGIDSFIAGRQYNHGGLSLQECVVPQLSIQAGKSPRVSAKIGSYKWAGLRCRIKVESRVEGCRVDLREKAADAASSLVAGAKTVGKDGPTALIVDNDAHEGKAAFLVLLDPAGNVIEKMNVTVGG